MSPSNIEFLAYEESPLGPLCLRRRELLSEPGTVVTEITLNHAFLMSSYHTVSERALAENGLEILRAAGSGSVSGSDSGAASDPKQGLRVLIGGLGLGYTAKAALLSDWVGQLDVVEFLPQVIDWMKQGLVPLSDELNGDPRFRPILGDVYRLLAEPPKPEMEGDRYDLILIDVDHSPDDRLGGVNERFYTTEGLVEARQHLAPGGVLGVWSYAENSPFADSLREVFEHVQVVPIRFFNRMVEKDEEDWLFFAW